MNDTATRDERRSALDEFAAKTMREPGQDVATIPQAATGLPAIHGAQAVAVKRDTRSVLREIGELAAAAGSDWYYRWPVKNKRKNTTDWVEGPSIKLANDIARIFGNCEIDCRVQDIGSHFLFHARFVDLQTGYALTRPFQQRKSAARMGDDAARNEDIALQIGASKAIRNVTVNALQTYADYAMEEAKGALVDKIGGQIERYRSSTVERIGKLVSLDRVEAVVGRPAKDWLAPDIARVIAMGTAIADGMATIDETFPPLGSSDDEKAEQAKSALDQFADKVEDAETSEAPTSPPASQTSDAVAGETEPLSTSPAADPQARLEMIGKVLWTATDKTLTPEERVEVLDQSQAMWADTLPGDELVATAHRTATNVASGKMKAETAKQYLEGLLKP